MIEKYLVKESNITLNCWRKLICTLLYVKVALFTHAHTDIVLWLGWAVAEPPSHLLIHTDACECVHCRMWRGSHFCYRFLSLCLLTRGKPPNNPPLERLSNHTPETLWFDRRSHEWFQSCVEECSVVFPSLYTRRKWSSCGRSSLSMSSFHPSYRMLTV